MIELLEQDYAAIEYYRDFLPKRIFDAHVHLYAEGTVPELYGGAFYTATEGTVGGYFSDVKPFYPGLKSHGLLAMPMPVISMNARQELRDKANLHVTGMAERAECVSGVYITPSDSEERIDELASVRGVRALKCYVYSSGAADLEKTHPGDFLPEAAWRVANRRSMPIILHLFRTEALSDPINLEYVTKMVARYPDARLVLAHCARAFSARTVIDSVKALASYENVYFDTAAICECAPIMACIKNCGVERVMFGTDYPIYPRGRAISLGLGSYWLSDDVLPHSTKPVVMLAEQLIALKHTAELFGLDATDIEKIFYKNAERCFGFSNK